jgi:hypothetical protein
MSNKYMIFGARVNPHNNTHTHSWRYARVSFTHASKELVMQPCAEFSHDSHLFSIAQECLLVLSRQRLCIDNALNVFQASRFWSTIRRSFDSAAPCLPQAISRLSRAEHYLGKKAKWDKLNMAAEVHNMT